MTLRKSSPVPLYHQVVREIRRRIRTGAWAPGARLPSERELAEEFGISRMTLRQALARLVQDGTLTVRQGAGTFVAEPKLTFDAVNLMGFTETMLQQDGTVSSDVLRQDTATSPPHVATALALRPDETVVRVARLRRVNGEPVALESSWLPHRLCRGLENQDLAHQSLYRLLEERYGLPLQRAEQTIAATTASVEEADAFDVPEGTGLLAVEGISYSEDDLPTEYFEVRYRGDRFKLAVASDRHARSEAEAAAPGIAVVLSQARRDAPS
ncbi:MAG: phosphonate metabolism transcriptional regulator PhnF [Trueperaceae bacterium]|nr:phosphonate metabolism transcriptional regulator PhnF [Trueperaceae bacterium]